MQTNITEKLAHKVAEILHNYNTMKNENEQLRLEIITLQAEREIKNQEIQRLNDQNTMKDMEIEEIVNNIESMLGSN
jgi:cell division protein FtsB